MSLDGGTKVAMTGAACPPGVGELGMVFSSSGVGKIAPRGSCTVPNGLSPSSATPPVCHVAENVS